MLSDIFPAETQNQLLLKPLMENSFLVVFVLMKALARLITFPATVFTFPTNAIVITIVPV